MSDILSQDEIESLLSSLKAGEKPEAVESQVHGSAGKSLKGKTVVNYDLSQADRLSREQLRGVRTLMEHFVRQYALALSALLRLPVKGDTRSAEQLDYGDFIQSLGPSVLYVLEGKGMRKRWVLQVSHSLIMLAVDRLLGGMGVPPEEVVRPPTEIELALVKRLVERALETLESVWRHLVHLELEVVGVETDVELAQVFPHTERVIVVPLVFNVRETPVQMAICLPYVFLKPLAQRLSGRMWEAARSSLDSAAPRELAHNLAKASLELLCSFPPVSLTLRELAKLSVGDVLPLPAHQSSPSVEVIIGGRRKFIGSPGIRGGHLAVSIAEQVEE